MTPAGLTEFGSGLKGHMRRGALNAEHKPPLRLRGTRLQQSLMVPAGQNPQAGALEHLGYLSRAEH